MEILKNLLYIFLKSFFEKKAPKKKFPKIQKPKYRFSRRSQSNLIGVHPALVQICYEMIKHIDFAVIEGKRSPERQLEMIRNKSSRIDPKKIHLAPHVRGYAVDLMAFHDGRGSWFHEHYFPLADQFIKAVLNRKDINTKYRWGGAWNCTNLREASYAKDIYENYIIYKNERRETPFVDMPHFEIYKRGVDA